MSTLTDKAIETFNSGFNCAQSVFSVFCEKYGLEKENGLKISCGLGGGFRSGEICGAVSGAVLVIGLKYGQFAQGDADSKSNCYAKTVEFMNLFKNTNNSVVCREILGHDISTKNGHEQAQIKNLFKTTCSSMIESAVKILEELGY